MEDSNCYGLKKLEFNLFKLKIQSLICYQAQNLELLFLLSLFFKIAVKKISLLFYLFIFWKTVVKSLL